MILMVYNRRQCREFLLPNLRNADYEILLPWQEYGLTRRGPICLEVTKKGWVLDSTEDYQVRKNGQDVLNCLLKDQDILELRLADGNSVKVIVADADLSFIITRKYDLSGMSQVSVGKADGNIIRYDFRDLISGCHAELIRHSDGWYLTDRSSNGVFYGEGRIQGSRRLDFFEHLNIFGLHLVFLGDILAVGTYYGSLSVREDIQSLDILHLHPAFWSTHRCMSSPSCPASPQLMISSACVTSCRIISNCFCIPGSSINFIPNRLGSMGSSDSVHRFHSSW